MLHSVLRSELGSRVFILTYYNFVVCHDSVRLLICGLGINANYINITGLITGRLCVSLSI